MSRVLDTVVAYRVLRMLATPIEQSDAFKRGIVDKDGNKLRDPEGAQELDSYTLLQRFVYKVQKALTRSPDRNAKRLLTFAAALAILREYTEDDDVESLLEVYEQDETVQQHAKLLEKNLLSFSSFSMSEMMSVGGGGIHGIGVGPKGEPGRDPVFQPMFRRKRKKKDASRN